MTIYDIILKQLFVDNIDINDYYTLNVTIICISQHIKKLPVVS